MGGFQIVIVDPALLGQSGADALLGSPCPVSWPALRADEVIGPILGRSRRTSELDRLTRREREAVSLMAEGRAPHRRVRLLDIHRRERSPFHDRR